MPCVGNDNSSVQRKGYSVQFTVDKEGSISYKYMRIYLYAALFGKVDVSNVGWALA